jgi:D-alanyl-D-alanine carboxypeptidase
MKLMHTSRKKMYSIIAISICAVILGTIYTYTILSQAQKKASSKSIAPHQKKTSNMLDRKIVNKMRYSIDQPGSLWWIVNKERPAGESYLPNNLVTPPVTLNTQKSAEENMVRQELVKPIEQLFNDAKKEGIAFMLASGYRSYVLQQTYYSNYVNTSGEAEANRYSAKPGTSEHQTGLSFDIANADRTHYLDQSFGQDTSGQWIASHAHHYGFIVRYPEGKEVITGYMYEPWHLRYVGVDLATELYKNQQTMEEFFNLSI